MSKAFACLVIILSLTLAFNASSTGIIGLLVWLFIITSALSAIFQRKPVSHFIGRLLGLIIGPVLVCCLVRLLLARLHSTFASGPSSFSLVLLLLLLMALSFLYVRRQILGRSKHEAKELQTNERRPILPPLTENEDKEVRHHAGH